MKPLVAAWLGRVPYADALVAQRARRAAVITGEAPEILWLLEHDPVITTGRRDVGALPDAETLAAHGVALFHTERGGLATWHGPGQLVGYLIVDLPSRGLKVRRVVAAVEQGVIDWLSARGVAASRRAGYPGVWVGRDKICAVGMHFSRGVSMHGFALNLTNELTGYRWIVPCGIVDGGVTRLVALQADAPTPEFAWEGVAGAIRAALERASD